MLRSRFPLSPGPAAHRRTVPGTGRRCQKSTGTPVDVVFCLDLSSSANTLIDHFRNHLWDYWRFFARCKPRPNFRIGVVAYSRFSYGKQTGYNKVIRTWAPTSNA
ncbi:hypothetical protein [Candidatus Pollutiaquabacter sp.]|uniref:hypothetical protein n=1 Tax=Candidatus Pollutiaquabacter sp. TaxID=3416354 RepID=UPI003C88BD4C|nr:hypothetical protein [Bacteroidota bacterium]